MISLEKDIRILGEIYKAFYAQLQGKKINSCEYERKRYNFSEEAARCIDKLQRSECNARATEKAIRCARIICRGYYAIKKGNPDFEDADLGNLISRLTDEMVMADARKLQGKDLIVFYKTGDTCGGDRMKKIKRSDIKLLSHIREKKDRMDHMQMLSEFADMAPPGIDHVHLGYALMEQIDTLRQIKELESSICNDSR